MSIKKQSEQQIYGRNDMVNIEPNKKIYGSLGKTEKWFFSTVEGNPVTMSNSRKGSFEKEVTEFDLYGWSKQETTTGKNLCSIKSCQLSTNMVVSDIVPWTKKDKIYFSCDTEKVENSKVYVSIVYYDGNKKILGTNGAIIPCDGTRKETSFSGREAGSNSANIDLTTVEYISAKVGLSNSSAPTSFIDNIMSCGEANQPYELYTGGKPSPSPEYPQEIVSVGESGSINVEITGKNLFGGKTFADKVKDSFKGEIDETQKTIAFYAQNTKSVVLFNVPDKNKRYTLIAKGNCSSKVQYLNLCFLYDNGEQESLFFNNANTKQSFVSNAHKKLVSIAGYYNDGLTKLYYEDFGLFEGVLTLNDFEPYHKSTTTIPLSNGLPGIPVTTGGNYTDANGKQYICDEIDFVRGKYIQRVWQAEFDGSEDEKWLKGDANYISNGCLPVVMNSRKGFCNQYIVGNDTRGIRIGNGNAMLIVFDDFSDENALSNFKAHLASNPLVVMTYLDTPIERDLAPEEIEAYQSLVTYDGTTIVENDAECYTKITYMAKGN